MENRFPIQQKINFLQVAEVKLSYITKVKPADRPKITTSKDAQNILYDYWDLSTIEHTESFKILLLNRFNSVLGITTISNGGITGTVVDIRVIFQYALKANSSSIILCHNHPSNNPQPSEQDLSITRKISDAGKLLDISVLDHIILTIDKALYTSLADDGRM